jgi:cytochrome P450
LHSQQFTIGGYVIPAHLDVMPHIGAVLNDADLFEKPDEFNPERFLLNDMKTANKEAIDNVYI